MTSRSLTVHCSQPESGPVLRGDPPLLDRDAVHVHFAELAELRPRKDLFSSVLDEDERSRAARFKFATDRERFILGHGWMRTVLAQYTGRAPYAIETLRGRFGKPYLPGGELYFNLSDTKDAVVIAVSRSIDTGVDVETLDRRVDHQAVGEHYFTQEEQALIGRSTDGKRTFLDLWTRKEAVLKASGVGIMDDLRSLRVDGPENHLSIRHVEFMAMAAEHYHVCTWYVGASHILSLATPRPAGQVVLLGA